MPEAAQTHTPNPPIVVAALPLFTVGQGDYGYTSVAVSVRVPPDERLLLAACHAASARRHAMAVLMASVSELPPTDPRHDAAYAVVEGLRQDWTRRVERVCAIRAQGEQGLIAKAGLLQDLIDRDTVVRVDGDPTLRMAASLADDLLVLSEN